MRDSANFAISCTRSCCEVYVRISLSGLLRSRLLVAIHSERCISPFEDLTLQRGLRLSIANLDVMRTAHETAKKCERDDGGKNNERQMDRERDL